MTRRVVSPADVALYWQQRHQGKSQRDAARIAGVHVNTASNWERKAARAKLDAVAQLGAVRVDGGIQNDQQRQYVADELNGPVSPARLNTRAKRALQDFDYFRRVYLGRVPSPWQVEAAYQIEELLNSPDKEFVLLNVPPGAGKSTLWHDVAVWQICKQRSIRILIGSVSGKLATQYSRRIKETLERQEPLTPSDMEVARGLAVPAEATLSQDFGRFQPIHKGSLWRADEFIVEQHGNQGINNKEPTVSAYGMDAEYIGHRADLCLFDDVATTENARESAARDRLLEKWDAVAEARCEPGGLLAVIGQRLGPGDLYAHCLAKKAVDWETLEDDGLDPTAVPTDGPLEETTSIYRHIVYKAYYPELDTGLKSRRSDAPAWPHGPLLDPRRLSWKDIAWLRQSNPNKFAVVYQQEANEETQNLILRVHATGGMGPDGVQYPGCIDQDRMPGWAPANLAAPVLSIGTIDPSPSEFWGIQWWLYQPASELRFLVDVMRVKLTAEEVLGYDTMTGGYSGIMDEWQARSVAQGYPISHWVVEVNAAQRFLLAHDFVRKWQALHRVNVIPHTTHRNKWDEKLGIEALLPPLWRSGAVRLPTMRGNWKTLALVDEMCKWRPDKKHGTDLVMAHWFAELHWPTVAEIPRPPQMWRPSFMRTA